MQKSKQLLIVSCKAMKGGREDGGMPLKKIECKFCQLADRGQLTVQDGHPHPVNGRLSEG